MKLNIEIKKNTKITKKESELMYKAKKKEFGTQDIKDFKKEYPKSIFFFLKENNKIIAFGTLRNLTLLYKKKKYKIFGICNIFTIKRGQGYGRILIEAIIKYIKKTNKTALGFCAPKKTKFYKKTGLKTKKEFIQRVVYKNPKGELEPESGADAIYLEGKDRLITKMLSTKDMSYTDLKEW